MEGFNKNLVLAATAGAALAYFFLKGRRTHTSYASLGSAVQAEVGRNGMDCVTLKHPSGASVSLYKFGAHITSWKLDTKKEMLFLSENAVYDGATPIRGGIPLVFPQFGGGDLPNHGFARTSHWDIRAVESNILVMELIDNEKTRGMWRNYAFRLLYTIELGAKTLKTTLTVVNRGAEPFEFQALLHTYYGLVDIANVGVVGLKDHAFMNKLTNHSVSQENSKVFRFDGEVDSIYTGSPRSLHLTGTGLAGSGDSVEIEIGATGSTGHDVVVWNPHVAKAKRMGDFGDHEWKSMCCIEPGFVAKRTTLHPNGEWSLYQTLTAAGVDK